MDPRAKIAAAWAATMFIFAYVDLFAFYRADFRAEVESGTVAGFDIAPGFLMFTTIYVMLPSLMVYLSVVLPRQSSRFLNLVLPVLYAASIVVAARGEWAYFLLGSAVEIALLAAIVVHAWKWRPTTEPR